MPNTPILQLPYPTSADTADVPRDIQALALALDPLATVPVGAMMLWPGAAAPTAAWLLCKGQQVDAAAYPLLAGVLGQTGGQITIPDMQDRFPAGAGATNGALNATGGAQSVALTAAQSGMPAHNVAVNDPGHAHQAKGVGIFAGAGAQEFITPTGGDVNAAGNPILAAWTGITASVAAQNAALGHENRPLYRAVNFIIRAL